jgi:hypothetical protein
VWFASGGLFLLLKTFSASLQLGDDRTHLIDIDSWTLVLCRFLPRFALLCLFSSRARSERYRPVDQFWPERVISRDDRRHCAAECLRSASAHCAKEGDPEAGNDLIACQRTAPRMRGTNAINSALRLRGVNHGGQLPAIVPRRDRSLSQCDSPFSEFRKGYNQPEVNAGLQCDCRKFSIDRPLPRHKKVKWWQTWTNYHVSDSETQWQHGWRMMTPAAHPGCFRGSQVPAFPDMKRHSWQKLERVLGRALRRGVCEGDRVLEKETHHEPWNAGVNDSECRARLPRALAGAPGGRCVWRIADFRHKSAIRHTQAKRPSVLLNRTEPSIALRATNPRLR